MNQFSKNPGPPPGGCSETLRARIVEKIRSFPAMPAFVAQAISLMNEPNADASQVADKIKIDPGMTANVLRLANSAEFGSHRSVRSIQEAVVRLGFKQLFQLLVASGMGHRLTRVLPGYDMQADEFLRHSLWAALAAEEFCQVLQIQTPSLLFTAGLLHDLGKLILDEFIAERRAELLAILSSRAISFDEVEREVLGMDHATAGATVADVWHFPPELVATARWHHQPEKAGEFVHIASIVHIGEFLAYAEGIGTGMDGLSYRLSDEAIRTLGITKRNIELVASHTLDKMRDLEAILKE